ncbi:unnamed protein product [Schistosoma turkestanicum]|nr:unnamed protein product [Schistosoma turkestanicum]
MSYLKQFPIRLESWLDVWDVDSIEHSYSEWKYFAYNLPNPVWMKKFCVIVENEQRFYIFNSKHDSSCLLSSSPHTDISTINNDEDYYALQTTAYNTLTNNIDNNHSYYPFNNNSYADNHETLFNSTTTTMCTLLMITHLIYVYSLRRTAKPNLENEYHLENSLKLSILEARNIPAKRRYYCDICLDRTLYARTTSKLAVSGIFWAEDFDLNNLPNVSVMTISLYREGGGGGGSTGKDSRRIGTPRLGLKKHRKTQNQLVGYITIPVTEISSRTDIQTWLTLQPPMENSVSQDNLMHSFGAMYADFQRCDKLNSVKLNKFNSCSSSASSSTTNLLHNHSVNNNTLTDYTHFPQLRICARYQSLGVLPLYNYWPLRTLVLNNSLLLTNWLESLLLSVKLKEELSNSLVYLHESNNTLIEFLTDLVVREVSNLENESMAFRSNTMATKAVECYVKFVGSSYLHHLLHLLIQHVLSYFTPWEIDPEKLTSTQCIGGALSASDTAAYAVSPSGMLQNYRSVSTDTLIGNQLMLLRYFDIVWRAIQSSLNYFPSVLIRLFSSFREALETIRGSEFCDNLISSCIFLRLICPALLSPSLFGLISAFPSEPACQRNLTLLAKSLQSLANFSTFDDKEPYMRFLNGYVSYQLSFMRLFIRSISSSSLNSPSTTDPMPNVISTHSVEMMNNPASSSTPSSPPISDSEQRNISTTTASVNRQSYVKDTIDENCELANLHLILSDVIFSDTPMISVHSNDDTLLSTRTATLTTTNNNNTTTSTLNTTVTADTTITNNVVFGSTSSNNNSNNNNLTTVHSTCDDKHCLSNSTTTLLENSTNSFLKTPNSTVLINLPNELCQLPKILDDISRLLQTSSLTKSFDFNKTRHSVNNHNINHPRSQDVNDLSNSSSINKYQQSNLIVSSSNNDVADHQTNTQSTTPYYYTFHSNPGFYKPSLIDQYNKNNETNSSQGLLLLCIPPPSLKQSNASLNHGDGDADNHGGSIMKSNPNDYDEPYVSDDESDYEINHFAISNHDCFSNANPEKKVNIIDHEPHDHDEQELTYSENTLNTSTKHQKQPNELLQKSNSHKSILLTNNNTLTSTIQVPFNGIETSCSTNSLHNHYNHTSSISPRLFPKQVTTANVILLTKPTSVMTSSTDSTKISKVQRQFRSNSNSRENMYDRRRAVNAAADDADDDGEFLFGPPPPTTTTTLSLNYQNQNYPNDNYLTLSSTEELLPSQSDATSYNILQMEEDNSSYSLANHTTNNNNNSSNTKQPKELFTEVARLRYELLLSRQDALRAADRLSKQETEIYQLRQLLDQLINKNKINTTTATTATTTSISSQSSHLKKTPKWWNIDSDYCVNNAQQKKNTMQSYGDNQPAYSSSRKQSTAAVTANMTTTTTTTSSSSNNNNNRNTHNNDANVLQTVSATFKELDDAMARLELEQSELLREQARIRARIAATRPKQSISQSKQFNPNLPSTRSNQSVIPAKQFNASSSSKLSVNLRNHASLSTNPTDQMKFRNSPHIIHNDNNHNNHNHNHNGNHHLNPTNHNKSSTRTSPHM